MAISFSVAYSQNLSKNGFFAKWVDKGTLSLIISFNVHCIMRGRIAAAAVGAKVAKNKAQAAGAQQEAANQQQIDQLKAEQQKQIDELKQEQSKPQQSSGQEDITQKLQKLANLKQQGLISEEEYQKSKADLLAKL
jgi:primosomal protein N'